MSESLVQDLRYAYRNLQRHPGFTAVAVVSLALGIGANTAIFSFIDTVLLRDLPVSHPEQLAVFGDGQSRGVSGGDPEGAMDLFSWQEFRDFRERSSVFSGVLALNSQGRNGVYVTIPGEASTGIPEYAQANLVSGNFFSVLGVRPEAGRFFDASADNAIGASPYVVLSDAYWESRFHRDPSLIGQPMQIGGLSYTVLGVAPRGFFGIRLGEAPDLWIPLSMQPRMPGARNLLANPGLHFANLIGRLKPGVTLKQAQSGVDVLYAGMLPPEAKGRARVVLAPGGQGLSGLRAEYALPLEILMTVVAMVLLIACANVANLQLALASRRQKEFALRFAIGAGRTRIVRQLLTESFLLSGCGGLLGILLANGAGKLLVHLISTGPRALPLEFSLEPRVLGFTVLLSLATGLLFGLAPAFRVSRVDLNSSLKESKASMAAPGKVTFGRALVAGQVAASFGLLIAAGLLLHSFSNLVSLNAGFDRGHVLLFKLDTDSTGYKPERVMNLYRQLDERVARLPGVDSEGLSLFSFGEGSRTAAFDVPGVNLPEASRSAGLNYVSPGYFATLRIPVVAGRALQDSDTAASARAAVISESFANRLFGSPANALGRTIAWEDNPTRPISVVGVLRDTKTVSVRDREVPMAWFSVYQEPSYARNLAVRVSGDPAPVAAAVRRTIRSVDPNLPLRWTTTLADAVSDSLVQARAIAQLSAFFAGLALFLSAIGLYGTISFAVARRTNEIGIRMALGAERVAVVGMVLRDTALLAGAGLLAGLPLAWLASRGLRSMLYGLSAFDAVTVAGAAGVLSVAVLIAGYLPARRAASVDPMTALRYE